MRKKARELVQEIQNFDKLTYSGYLELKRLGIQLYDACYKVDYIQGMYYICVHRNEGGVLVDKTKGFIYNKATKGEITKLKRELGVVDDPNYVDRNSK